MKGRLAACAAFWVALCAGQTRHVEIDLPPNVPSDRVFVRYVLAGQDLGGWIYGPPGVSSFGIGTVADGRPASGIKAILYAPGCAIQTLDLQLAGDDPVRRPFVCEPVRNVEIRGVLARPERLGSPGVKLQVKYVSRWAQEFLELDGVLATNIPVGEAAAVSEGRFRLSIPDFAADASAAKQDRGGEFQIWVKDDRGETVVGMLVPQESVRARMRGLIALHEYPFDVTFTPCMVSTEPRHDKIGFAIRSDVNDPCDPL
jgi:hypothetical protein